MLSPKQRKRMIALGVKRWLRTGIFCTHAGTYLGTVSWRGVHLLVRFVPRAYFKNVSLAGLVQMELP